jgi:hypothetical protein
MLLNFSPISPSTLLLLLSRTQSNRAQVSATAAAAVVLVHGIFLLEKCSSCEVHLTSSLLYIFHITAFALDAALLAVYHMTE